jgi:uncharacterized protein YciI
MPRYIYRGTVDPDMRGERERLRDEHLAYQGARPNLAGGPLVDDHGTATGSLIIFDAPDRQAAEARIAADPFIIHGVVSYWTLDVFDAVDTTRLARDQAP